MNYSYVILAFLMVILVLWSFEWGKKFKGIAIDDQMTTWIYYYVLDTFKCISPLELHLNSWKGTKCSFSFLAFPNILASENQFFIDGFKNMVPSKFLPAPSIYARPPTLKAFPLCIGNIKNQFGCFKQLMLVKKLIQMHFQEFLPEI